MAELHVFYQFNQRYLPYAGVSITSLLENNRDAEDITLYLLLEQVEPEGERTLTQLIQSYGRRAVVAPTAALLAKAEALGIPQYRGSSAANLRLFFPDQMPETVQRLLYLDSDTIVCGSLQGLFGADLQGGWLGMVRDSMTGDYPAALGLGAQEPYCNSGMVLFDLQAWRANRCGQRLIRHIQTVRAGYPNPDQDLLNMAFRGHITALGPEYNFQPCHRAYPDKAFFACRGGQPYYTAAQLQQARQAPVVLHTYRFLGQFPWHKNNLHPDSGAFDHYLALSPWRDYQKQPAPGGLLFGVERALYRLLPRGLFFRILSAQQSLSFRRAEKQLRTPAK